MARVKTLKSRVKIANISRARMITPPKHYGRGRGGRPWRRLRERVYLRDKQRCRQCFERGINKPLLLHSKDPGLVAYCDHWIPEAQGGENGERNLWTLCYDCHEIKTKEDNVGKLREARDFGVYEIPITLA